MSLNKGNILEFDLIALGGGIAASLLAINLLKKNTSIKIAIIEKSTEFPQKIGESSSDMTAICLRSFDINHLLKDLVPKSGLRFLFNESNSEKIAEFSSPSFPSKYTGFQFNRKTFDQQLLNEAEKLGAIVYRPAELEETTFKPFDITCTINYNQEQIKLHSKWFLDATGRARYIHNQLKWKDAEIPLNTGSVYAHFTNLAPIEEWGVETDSYWKKNSIGDGSFSTIHFMRPNRWWWFIRIDAITTSIGVVYDKNKFQFDDSESMLQYELENDSQLKKITAKSSRTKAYTFETVPYQSERFSKDGILLIGDSGSMIDPLQSPGIELICQQAIWLSELVSDEYNSKLFDEKKWSKYEKIFRKGIADRMKIYAAGYNFMESYDLSKNWLRAGSLGYFGNTVFKSVLFPKKKKYPFKFTFLSELSFNFLVWRLNKISARRKKQGRVSKYTTGKPTHSGIYYSKGFLFYCIPFRLFFLWFADYMVLEAKEIKYWFKK